jgi:uncharacterized protein YxjI
MRAGDKTMQFPLRFPLTLSFKIIAMAPQLSVTDAGGNQVDYINQKLFKLKEEVNVFEDVQQTRVAFTMKADRVIDFSPRFTFADSLGHTVGAIKRQGRRSLWKAHYDVYEGDKVTMLIREENPWVKVWDGLFTEIPIVGMFSGYLFHPAYLLTAPDGRLLLKMKKQPAMWEGKFTVDKHVELSPEDEKRALLSLMVTLLMERERG